MCHHGFLGKWVHLAFSWKDGEIRMYINGEVVSEVKNNFLLNISNFTSFNLFNNLVKTFSIQSFIDEFRISSKVRSASDIFDGYLKGLNLGTLSLISNPMDTIQMYESWIIYLFKKRFWNVPQLYLTDGKDTLYYIQRSRKMDCFWYIHPKFNQMDWLK